MVRNYYAHHHGMSILAIDNVIFQGRMRDRFHRDPIVEAIQFLLQERAPHQISIIHSKVIDRMRNNCREFDDAPLRIIKTHCLNHVKLCSYLMVPILQC